MNIIAFHASCPDGFTAAYVAKLKYPEAELMPLNHGAALDIEQFRGKDVLMVDFSLRTREQNDQLAAIAKSFRIYDHHKTAEAVLDGAKYAIFDMKRSGAGLAWDYLFGKDAPLMWYGEEIGKPLAYQTRPYWVDFVEDRDLWNWALPKSKEVNSYIMTLPMTIEAWDGLSKITSERAAELGAGALAHVDHYVREVVKHAQHGHLNILDKHYTVAVVNAPYLNISEVGNELAKTADIGMGWFERGDGLIQFSLRSQGDIDVSEIVKQFGGGGHQHAAGFQLSLGKGRELIDTVLNRFITLEKILQELSGGLKY